VAEPSTVETLQRPIDAVNSFDSASRVTPGDARARARAVSLTMPPTSVLLVEDDDAVRGFFEVSLRNAGFSVRSIPLASETFEALRAGTPDVIVLDLGMPRGSLQGMEMLTQLREVEAWRELPVVILSAFGDVVNRDVTRRLGVAAVLAKPLLEIEELTRTIREIGQ
jgi:DNA-binding response OmpR family regulator